MKGRIKVHGFGVQTGKGSKDLDDLLNLIRSQSLASREREVGLVKSKLRIEDVTIKGGLYYFDFGKFRTQHGPGKGAPGKPTKGFKFKKGEAFCEETCALYIPKSQKIILQYNHFGARVSAISEYLNFYTGNDDFQLEIVPMLDPKVSARLQNRNSTKKLTFDIDPRFLSDADRTAGTALTQAIDIGKDSSGEKISITIDAGIGKGKTLNNFVDNTIAALQKLSTTKPDGVNKVEVAIRETQDSALQVLDLLEQRLSHEFKNINIGIDLRYSRHDRYHALERAYSSWSKLGLI